MCKLMLREFRVSPAPTTAGTRGDKAGIGALANEVALHLGERRHHMKKEASGRRARIDTVGKAPKLHSLGLQALSERDKLPNRTSEAIQLPDHKAITRAQVRKCLGQARTVVPGTSGLVRKDPFAASSIECIQLQVEVLVRARNSGVADQHATPP